MRFASALNPEKPRSVWKDNAHSTLFWYYHHKIHTKSLYVMNRLNNVYLYVCTWWREKGQSERKSLFIIYFCYNSNPMCSISSCQTKVPPFLLVNVLFHDNWSLTDRCKQVLLFGRFSCIISLFQYRKKKSLYSTGMLLCILELLWARSKTFF